MSARSQRGGVVHAVAGHGHDVAVGLQRLDDPDLVLGRHPGAHADVVDLRGQLLVGHALELVTGDDPAVDAELGGDGAGGGGVVAGDHLHRDAGRAAQPDRVAGLGAGRVDDADEGVEGEVVDPAVGIDDGAAGVEHLGSAGRRREATASTRRPSDASDRCRHGAAASAWRRAAARRPRRRRWRSTGASSTSGAPLTQTSTSLAGVAGIARWNVAMNLWAESNGHLTEAGMLAAGRRRRCRPWPRRRRARPRSGRRRCRGRRRSSLDGVGAEGRGEQRPSGQRVRSPPPVDVDDLAVGGVALARQVQTAPPSTTSRTVIWLRVRVPVLSEQITMVEPSVSTEWRRFTMACAWPCG